MGNLFKSSECKGGVDHGLFSTHKCSTRTPSASRGGVENRRAVRPRRLSDVTWRFREAKRQRRQGECWSQHEQQLFYKVLNCTHHTCIVWIRSLQCSGRLS